MNDDEKPKVGWKQDVLVGSAPLDKRDGMARLKPFMRVEQSAVGGEPTVDQEIQDHIGRKLKEVYEDLARQPVPDRFRQLLEELERKEKK